MAVILYLDDTQVFPDDQQSIKLTKENPYFTQSDSYTMDVTLPMSIMQNRSFFKNVNRLERRKKVSRMTCQLLVDNRLLLSGSAKVTQITDKEVKVQLLGGNSEINLLSQDESSYIDNLSLGKITYTRNSGINAGGTYHIDTDVRFRTSDIFNETTEVRATCFQFCLLDVTRQIFRVFGLEVTECSIDKTPWNSIYIANAKSTYDVAHTLPHWSFKTFIDEFCKFFNVSVIIDQEHRKVAIKDNPTFFSANGSLVIDPADEYSAELNEDSDAHALASDNLRFDMSDSSHHDYDVIPDNVREGAPTDSFPSRTAAYNAWAEATEDDRTGKIYACPEGRYTGWIHDYSDIGGDEEKLVFTQIDIFAPLIRDAENNGETELKICPVAIGEIEFEMNYGFGSQGNMKEYTRTWKEHIPALESPTGNDTPTRNYSASGIFGGRRSSQDSSSYEATIQEYVEGEASIEKEEKEDRLQVMFMDDVKQPCHYHDERTNTDEELSVDAGFTDFQYKRAHKDGTLHSPWSLSLNKCEATYYLGQLHENGFTFNLGAKLCVKFLSDTMPDPTKVFIIRNKRFGCEKIEAQIDASGIQQLMTGYFYEML